MGVNTPIADDISVTDQNAQYDAACRRLLSEKIVLAWIMKSCLDEYRDCDVKEIAEKYIESEPQVSKVAVAPDETNARIRGMSNEDTSLTEGKITYDVRFLATVPSSGELIQIIIDVEGQNKFDPGYPLLKRAVYYCSRMISVQHGTEFVHSEYQKIKKVVSIWVCMSPPDERKNTITRYHLTEENLVGNVKEPVRNYDLIDIVIPCLGGANGENYDGVLKLLDVLLSGEKSVNEKRQVLQEDFDIPMTQTLETEVLAMCNFSQGVMQKGIEKGKVEGRAEGFLVAIRNLMDSMGWSMEQAMEALRVSESDRSKYAELLQKQ